MSSVDNKRQQDAPKRRQSQRPHVEKRPSLLERARERFFGDDGLLPRERHILKLRKQWTQDVLPNWSSKMRESKKVQQLCWEGIPSSVRPLAWKAIIGNDTHITQDYFEILTNRSALIWEQQRRLDEQQAQIHRNEVRKNEEARQQDNVADAEKVEESSASSDAGTVQAVSSEQSIAVTSSEANGTVSSTAEEKQRNGTVEHKADDPEDLSAPAGKESTMRLIELDIPRTFPTLKIFHRGGPLFKPLLQVLRCYVVYRPDVGYVQGMSYLASMFVLNMETFDSFVGLANLLNREIFFDFFRMKVEHMKRLTAVFDRLLADRLPAVAKHFEKLDLVSEMFVYEWLLTIFSRSLPLDTAHRVWDNFFCHGPVFLFRVALGIVRMYSARIVTMSFEQVLQLLNGLPDMNEEELFSNIGAVPLSAEAFNATLSKVTSNRHSSDDLTM